MRAEDRIKALALRKKGASFSAIHKLLGVPRNTIVRWCRSISPKDIDISNIKNKRILAGLKASQSPNSLKNKWAAIRKATRDTARAELSTVKLDSAVAKSILAALYWGEGTKTVRNSFGFTNSDPVMVRLVVRLLLEFVGVPIEKIKGKMQLSPDLDEEECKRYWAEVSGIPESQFYKTQTNVSFMSRLKRKTLPYGTFVITISSTELRQKLEGWMQALKAFAEKDKETVEENLEWLLTTDALLIEAEHFCS